MLGKKIKLLTITLLTLLSTVSVRAIDTQYTAYVCGTGKYLFGCNTYTTSQSGLTQTLTAAGGGDSIVHLNLVFAQPKAVSFEASIKPGETYLFGCNTYTVTPATDPELTLESAAGCDSIVTLKLTVLDTVKTSYSTTIKPGEHYLFGCRDISYATAGGPYIYSDTLQGANRDSVVTLSLMVQGDTVKTSYSATIKPGEHYLFGCEDISYAAAGGPYIFSDTLKGVGRDSVVTLSLMVKGDTVKTVYTAEIKSDEVYLFGCRRLTKADDGKTFTDTLAGVGRDSLVSVTLKVKDDTIKVKYTADIYEDETYLFACEAIQRPVAVTPYIFTDTLKGLNRDSVVILELTVKSRCPVELVHGDTTAIICEGDLPWIWHGITITNDTTNCDDTIRSTTPGVCDSISRLAVTVIRPDTTDEGVHYVCDFSTPYSWHGQDLDHADVYWYTENHPISTLCAFHVYKLDLRQYQAKDSAEYVTMCDGESYEWKVAGQVVGTYDISGDYYKNLQYAAGCDSLRITLHLTVNTPKPAQVVYDTVCNGKNYDWVIDGDIVGTYSEAGTYTYTSHFATPSYTGSKCDSVAYTLHLFVDTIAAENIHHLADTTIYKGYSFIWMDGEAYVITADTLFKYYKHNHRGCDSVYYYQNVKYNSTIKRGDEDVTDVSCYGKVYQGRVSNITVVSDTAWTDSVRVWVKSAPVDSVYHYTVYVLDLPTQFPATLLDSLRAICGTPIDSTVAAVETTIHDYLASDPHFDAEKAEIGWFVKKGDKYVEMGSDIIKGETESVQVQCVVKDRCENAMSIERTLTVEDPAPYEGATLVPKYGQWLLVLHVNNLKAKNLIFTEEDIDWYQEMNGETKKLDYHGYYYTIGEEMIGKFSVVIHAQSASGCNETITSNTVNWSTPYKATIKLVPNVGHEGTTMRLINLNPDKEYIIYAYDEAGALMLRTTVNGEAEHDMKAEGRPGLYMLRVETGDKSETLRYIIK